MEMRILEENSEYLGVSKLMLMESAGGSVARMVREKFGEARRVLVVCGLGNNGGDGLVCARHLAGDYDVTVCLVGRPERIRASEARHNWKVLCRLEETIKVKILEDSAQLGSLREELASSDVVVDAIFGTGLRGRVRRPISDVISAINDRPGKYRVVAVDVPSGLNPDTGEVHGVAVKADCTVTFHLPKKGFRAPGASEYLGEVIVVPIGIPKEAEIICGPGDLAAVYKRRDPWSKKGDFGRILVVGGSKEYSGAPALVALASLRAGADLVTVASPASVAPVIRGFSPNLIVRPLGGDYLDGGDIPTVVELASKADAVVLGPGLSTNPETMGAVAELLEGSRGLRLIIDADALKALGGRRVRLSGNKAILTPHAGEFKVLSGEGLSTDVRERAEKAAEFAREIGAVVLLKGHVDVVTDGRRVKLNRTGNPGMTVGGTGDVLSGIAATFLAWSDDPFEAACASAFVNGRAGDIAVERMGYHIAATDVIGCIPEAMDEYLAYR